MSWYTTICYFGTKINKNKFSKYVTNIEWLKFVNNNINNRFKNFTVSKDIGYWEGEKELTYKLTLIHKNDENVMNNLIKIAKEYSILYKQDEVLINTTKSILLGINNDKIK